jgi:tRNA(Arg) A34 adenosine deaminase TadA
MHTINRPSIIRMAKNASQQASGMYKIGAVITKGTSNKPIVIGYNSNKRTTFHVGTRKNKGHRVVLCSQHAEMSVASQFIRRQPKGARVSSFD